MRGDLAGLKKWLGSGADPDQPGDFGTPALHWRVDAATGELVSDGEGVHLATEKAYGDFEFLVDWKLTQGCGDSGIYLRDYPQVQIWDPACEREQRNGADRGSGAVV